jgi:hypothetical protein
MLLLTVVLAGWVLGQLYKAIPVLTEPYRYQPSDKTVHLPAAGIAAVIGAAFAVSLILWLAAVILENVQFLARLAAKLRTASRRAAVLGAGMIVIAVVVPMLVWLCGNLYLLLHEHATIKTGGTETAAKTTAAGTAAVATAGYLAVISGIFLTIGRLTRPAAGWVWSHRSNLRALPTLVLQWLTVVFGVAVLIIGHAFVFARIISDALSSQWAWPDGWPGLLANWMFVAALLALAVLGGLVDQTRWSLHPFYRERLMTAFAVRRTLNDFGAVEARPYADAEVTALSSHSKSMPGFPQVVYLCAANVSGQGLAPAGRRAVPYTLSCDAVGSPRLGWIGTEKLEEVLSYPLKMDLTTQAAMAVSGAAFASAMGAAAAPFTLLFALTNARLGTWLPNPRFLLDPRQAGRIAPLGGFPRRRRITYLLREIFGIYPAGSRLLLVTDGGHYENLGLVELLRHAPAEAYCFDASGGEDIAASALGPAIALAHEELGVTITFRDPGQSGGTPPGPAPPAGTTTTTGQANGPFGLAPGSAADDQTLPGLKGRLARSCVLVADIEYPKFLGLGESSQGRLYFGRAILTSRTRWPVLAHAARNGRFPNDRTSDQWFDHTQFDAYHLLGRHVGQEVVAATGSKEGSTTSGSPAPTPAEG